MTQIVSSSRQSFGESVLDEQTRIIAEFKKKHLPWFLLYRKWISLLLSIVAILMYGRAAFEVPRSDGQLLMMILFLLFLFSSIIILCSNKMFTFAKLRRKINLQIEQDSAMKQILTDRKYATIITERKNCAEVMDQCRERIIELNSSEGSIKALEDYHKPCLNNLISEII
jgi:hypothetical protein